MDYNAPPSLSGELRGVSDRLRILETAAVSGILYQGPARALDIYYQPSVSKAVLVIATVTLSANSGANGSVTMKVSDEDSGGDTVGVAFLGHDGASTVTTQSIVAGIVPAGKYYVLDGFGTAVLFAVTEYAL